MNALGTRDPCLDPPERVTAAVGERVRVAELVATGTNGGAQEHVASLLSRIDRTRFDVRVISLSDGSSVRRWRALGVHVEVIEEPDDMRAASLVASTLEAWAAQVVHAHMYRAEVVGVLAARHLAEGGAPRPFLVATVHSSRVRSVEERQLLAGLTPEIDRLVAVSASIVDKLQREGRTSRTRVELIHNGVDLDRYDHTEACCTLPEEYGLPEGSQLVGVVARLEPEKGHATLLDAWPSVLARVPAARLIIVGEGSQADALRAHAARLGLLGEPARVGSSDGGHGVAPGASVVFTGRREDVPSVTAAFDVAVLPSYREAQGLVILEAMALARPVVASDVGGIPEMIEDGVTGLLVPPHDGAALADAIVRLLTDHPLADTIGRAGHRSVHERFCIQRTVAAVEALYGEGRAAWAEHASTRP